MSALMAWRRTLGVAALAVCVVAGAPAGARADAPAHRGAIASVQIVDLEDGHFVLRIQASGPQAFDVVRRAVVRSGPSQGRTRLDVRLYRAQMPDLPALPPQPFGTIRFDEEGAGHVLMRLVIAPGFEAQVRQAGSPGIVEVQITPATSRRPR